VYKSQIVGTFPELRPRGELAPALPPRPPAPPLAPAQRELERAADAAAAELGLVEAPGVRVIQALERLARVREVAGAPDPWPGALDALCLPRGNGAALCTPVCQAYSEALTRLREACAHRRAERAHRLLDALLRAFAHRYSERKREHSALDFEDLELLARELLRREPGVRERLRGRYRRIMVDELQDTNQVQLELIGALASGNLFTVGDAQQSIYGFRHADVELFERLAQERRDAGAHATLRVNFRSRPEILEALGAAFTHVWGERFTPLVAGRGDPDRGDPNRGDPDRGDPDRGDPDRGDPDRGDPPADGPRVELRLVDKGADWQAEGLAAPWRLAEARMLAERVAELLAEGVAAREIVVLTRATTDLRTYERALEERGVPTYLIGGRGYWGHPQVLDFVCLLRAVANPRDEEALLTVLASPLVGVSLDALVILLAAARAAGEDPWRMLQRGPAALAGLAAGDLRRLEVFVAWFAADRRGQMPAGGIEALIDRALEGTGYDLAVLAVPGGRRRLANVRKLMRLAREHEAAHGPDLRSFLALISERAREGAGAAREAEAPVEGEALDAVRLMTIHRSKGLEFAVVCVADLGRVRRPGNEVMRIGRDGRFGLRLAEAGSGRREPAMHYRVLGEERQRIEEAEERRLFYVAMTRAKERLVLGGAAAGLVGEECMGGRRSVVLRQQTDVNAAARGIEGRRGAPAAEQPGDGRPLAASVRRDQARQDQVV